jgi:anti-sigma B factor antagonist
MQPPDHSFNASVRHQSNVAIIELKGEVMAPAQAALNAAYKEALIQPITTILLNFAQVNYINSGGIARLVTLLHQASQSELQIYACHLSDYYVELLEITRLSEFIQVYPDEASALAAIGES